jgi:hypothetical protein
MYRETVLAVVMTMALAQASSSTKYTCTGQYCPSEVEYLRLQVAQIKAQNRLQTYLIARDAYNQSMADLTNLGNQVKEDNHWPDKVQFSPQDLTFTIPAPTPVPAKKP